MKGEGIPIGFTNFTNIICNNMNHLKLFIN